MKLKRQIAVLQELLAQWKDRAELSTIARASPGQQDLKKEDI